jgi:hypothetical protein
VDHHHPSPLPCQNEGTNPQACHRQRPLIHLSSSSLWGWCNAVVESHAPMLRGLEDLDPPPCVFCLPETQRRLPAPHRCPCPRLVREYQPAVLDHLLLLLFPPPHLLALPDQALFHISPFYSSTIAACGPMCHWLRRSLVSFTWPQRGAMADLLAPSVLCLQP